MSRPTCQALLVVLSSPTSTCCFFMLNIPDKCCLSPVICRLAGIFPSLRKYRDRFSKPKFRALKLLVVYTCLSIFLAPLKQASKTGIQLQDPWGVTRLVFPRLFGYIADLPELAVIGAFKGFNSLFPCDQCMVSCENYHALQQHTLSSGHLIGPNFLWNSMSPAYAAHASSAFLFSVF